MIIFLLGQIVGYGIWYTIGKEISILKMIMVELIICLICNIFLMFTVNIWMLLIYRLIIGTSCTFIMIVQKYLNENNHNINEKYQKLYVIIIMISWECGKLFGTYVGGNLYFDPTNVYKKTYPFLLIGIITMSLSIIIIVINIVLSTCRIIIERRNQIQEPIEREAMNIEPEFVDEHMRITIFEFLLNKVNFITLLSFGLLSGIHSSFSTIIKLLLTCTTKNNTLLKNYDQREYEYIFMISSLLSALVSTITITFIQDKSRKTYIVTIIFEFIAISIFPFMLLITDQKLIQAIIITSLSFLILSLFEISILHLSKKIKVLRDSCNFGLKYSVSKNISLLFGLIINTLVTIIFEYTTQKTIEQYIIDANTVFYFLSLLLFLPNLLLLLI